MDFNVLCSAIFLQWFEVLFLYWRNRWPSVFNLFRCCSLNNNTRRQDEFHAMTYLFFYYLKIMVHLPFVIRKISILYFYTAIYIYILDKTIQNNICVDATFYSNTLFLAPLSRSRMKAIHCPQSSVHKSG